MAIHFKQFLTPGIAQLSYLLGDDSKGVAAVVDPVPDCDRYIALARNLDLQITHIFETHIHADFMSGARELQQRLGNARIFCSAEGGAQYDFDHEALHDGDTHTFGSIELTAEFTPGHTPEHMSFLLAETQQEKDPWGVLSGDSLFVNSAGRPDLLGEEETEELVAQLYGTLCKFYGGLDDGVLLYPGHGQGSACGPDIGDRLTSTIGYERRFNKYLNCEGLEKFKEMMESEAPPVPTHYPRLKKVNARGPKTFGHRPIVPALPPEKFMDRLNKQDAILVDTRSMLAFGGGHIENAINIGAREELSVYAGWLLEPDQPILLVVEDASALEEIVAYFCRTGFIQFAGYLVGGMTQWNNEGLPINKVPQVSVHELHQDPDALQILDVRAPDEWEGGHIPGATHFFIGRMKEELPKLDKKKPVATYCATGYRASLAASILQRNGYQARNIPGSWSAWKSAGLPVEKS